jgi:D-glycero-beta-D-manno-heptose 1-phosphate adenylyltransferase
VPAARDQEGGIVAPAFEAKIHDPRALGWLAGLKRPLVFTNGVFDLLHRGHVTYLARAREQGAALLVALNSDASARRLGKGAARPLNALADRLAVVAGLESVNAVTWFDEDTPQALIAACRPDVLVKGGDWPVERIVGAADVLARGGRVLSIPFEHERSTTELVQRIRGSIDDA